MGQKQYDGNMVCSVCFVQEQNMICLSSGEAELMALVGGACEGIATRDQWSKMCGYANGTIVLCTDSSAVFCFVKRKGGNSTNTTCGHKDLLHACLGHGS